jgi:hypothetical protein
MSEYGFGYADPDGTSDLGETQDQQQGPKWFREGLANLSNQVKELKAENDRLKAAQQREQIAAALKTKGFAPQAAGLYQGEPNGLDDWLTANAPALAKLPAEGEQSSEQEQGAPQGPPPSIVTPESQAALARMQAMGAGGAAAPSGGEQETVSRLQSMEDPEQFAQFMREQGNKFF